MCLCGTASVPTVIAVICLQLEDLQKPNRFNSSNSTMNWETCMLSVTQNNTAALREFCAEHLCANTAYVIKSPAYCIPHIIMFWQTAHIPWSFYRAPCNHRRAPRAVYDAWENTALATQPHTVNIAQLHVGNGTL